MKKLGKKQIIILVCVLTLLLLIGGTYAYFSINASDEQTGAKVTGSATKEGNPTMQTMTKHLFLNLDASLMSQANAGKTYYANSDESGLALTTNPNYTLAIADLPEGDEILDCTYNYKVTATVQTAITDGSDADVNVVVGDRTLTLKEITDAGDTGIIVSGEFKNLVAGTSQRIGISSSVTNTSKVQDSLVGNIYTIKVEPYNNGDTKAFSCKLAYKIDSTKTLAQNLIDSDWLWQSGLEGDGYRYAGSGAVGESTNPNNFICFGTTDKSECTANQDKYMYRVLGVFSDANGDNHVKLIKYKQLGAYAWNTDAVNDVSWENSDMYKGLNGDYFLTNTTYDYMQNTTWTNKIENWTWSAVNTQTFNNGPSYKSKLTPSEIYLHEMNRAGKSSAVGEWTTPSAKIGLMYFSDYALSLGTRALAITGSTYDNRALLKTGWMHQSNNDTTKNNYEWTISRNGFDKKIYAWLVGPHGDGDLGVGVSFPCGSRPVFYLTSDVKITTTGDGSLENPYIIEG